jgi:hypothetical protein
LVKPAADRTDQSQESFSGARFSLIEYSRDEWSLCFAIFDRILGAESENSSLSFFITAPDSWIAAKRVPKPDQLTMLRRIQSDDMGVDLK